jgi:hypothetical protein
LHIVIERDFSVGNEQEHGGGRKLLGERRAVERRRVRDRTALWSSFGQFSSERRRHFSSVDDSVASSFRTFAGREPNRTRAWRVHQTRNRRQRTSDSGVLRVMHKGTANR